jgi:hypothetical protein
LLNTLAKETAIELAVNEAGRAVLLHKGPLKRDYAWIQYDPLTTTVQMITENGDIQELGVNIPEKIKHLLDRTRQIAVVEVTPELVCVKQILAVFNKVLT